MKLLIIVLATACWALMVTAWVAWWIARPASPDAFYTAAPDLAGAPGTLLREEPLTRDVPTNARAWRILFLTTSANGRSALASAIVLVARRPAAGPRPLVAWAHGTTGIVPGCAPSLQQNPINTIPELSEVISNGWVYVGADYAGLGTRGPHPYLVGEGEGRSVLDSIRAVRQLRGLSIENRAVIWGHSQGGHAALWAGIIAPRYAPDVNVAGVVALAPVTDLPALLEAPQPNAFTRITTAYVAHAYSETYPDVRHQAVVRPGARWIANDIASRCLAGRSLVSVLEASKLLPQTIFRIDPAAGAIGRRVRENMPTAPIKAPVLIVQGRDDDLILPAVQRKFVASRCAAGQKLEYRTYAGRDHHSLILGGSPAMTDLIQWTEDRFAGRPPGNDCSRVGRKRLAAIGAAYRHAEA